MLGYTITVKRPQISEDELMHWGVLGMKWGIRRYQNPDGSLTDEGRKHYGIHAARIDKKFAKAQSKRDRAAEYRSKAANARYKSDKAARGGFLRRPNEAKAARLNSDYLKNEKKAARLERQAARLEKKGRKMVKNANWYFDEVRTNDVDSKTLAIGKRHALNILDDFTDDFKNKRSNSYEYKEQIAKAAGFECLEGDWDESQFNPNGLHTLGNTLKVKTYPVDFEGPMDPKEFRSSIENNLKKIDSKTAQKEIADYLSSEVYVDDYQYKPKAKDIYVEDVTVNGKGEPESATYVVNDDDISVDVQFQYDSKKGKYVPKKREFSF